MTNRNIFDNFGLTNGLKNFFIPNHDVIIDEKPNIIRVRVQQENNTPGIKTPIISLDLNKRYRLTVTGYSGSKTHAFIAIVNNDDFKNIANPVYLKDVNREVTIEFTPTNKKVQVFIVVYLPNIDQVFYISDIKLSEVETVKKIEKLVVDDIHVNSDDLASPIIEENKIINEDNSSNLNNLLESFHKLNSIKTSSNDTNNIQEQTSSSCDTSDDEDDEIVCLMNPCNSFGLTSFNTGSFGVSSIVHTTMPINNQQKTIKEPPKMKNIQKENLDLGKRVVDKQIILVERIIEYINEFKILIEEFIALNSQTETTIENDVLKSKYIVFIKEVNYITLAKVDDILIFTPYYNHFDSCPLLIECNKHHVNDDDYNIYIKKYKVDTKSLEIDSIYELLFSDLDNWLENYQKAINNISEVYETLCSYKKQMNQDLRKLDNRMLVF